jgi:uncharacterized protein (TIGR02246 family)
MPTPPFSYLVIRCRAFTVTLGLSIALTPAIALAQDTARSAVPVPRLASDEAPIRAIIAEQVMAWNAGDATAFSASFAEDGSFTNIRGTVFYGHRAFEDRHAEIFRGFFKGSRLAMSPTRIRFVRSDVAIVDVATELSDLRGRTPPGVKARADGRIRTRLQEVFVKDKDRWYIASYHNVDVKDD